MFTPSPLSLYLLITTIALFVNGVSLGDTVSSLQHGTLRLDATDQWRLDSSDESSSEDERTTYLKQLKSMGRIHHQRGSLLQ